MFVCNNTSSILCCAEFAGISLIVFDNCHVAVEPMSPYAEIVSMLRDSPYYEHVRIFGMTSSIIGGLLEEPEQLEMRISQLETVLCARGGFPGSRGKK